MAGAAIGCASGSTAEPLGFVHSNFQLRWPIRAGNSKRDARRDLASPPHDRSHAIMNSALRIYKEHSSRRALGPPRPGRSLGAESATMPPRSMPTADAADSVGIPTGACRANAPATEKASDGDEGFGPAGASGPATELRASIEQALIELLDTRAQLGETLRAHYERKEQELVAAFATLTPFEAHDLHRRLSSPAPDDALASRFERLVAERQSRLLAFLKNAPRREARPSVSRPSASS